MTKIKTPAQLQALMEGRSDHFEAASTPGGIEAMEQAGQTAFVKADILPMDLTPDRYIWAQLGFIFGSQLQGNERIFQQAKLPPGWKKVATDHAMWSKLVDEKGRVRGAVFFKAAFYDYSAHAHLERRYTIMDLRTPDGKHGAGKAVMDCEPHGGTRPVIHVISNTVEPDYSDKEKWRAWCDQRDEDHAKARAWLQDNFPKWEDPTAYW